MIKVKADDIITVKGFYRDMEKRFYFSSVVSYATKNGDCPIKAVDRCRQAMIDHPYNGHKLHWASPEATMLTSHKRTIQEPVATGVEFGDKVKFEGRIFFIERGYNDNIQLVELEN